MTLEARIDACLKDYKNLFDDEIINIAYYTNMKHYLTVLSFFTCRSDMKKLIEKNLNDVEYTLGCIHKSIVGASVGGSMRVVGILNKASLSGRYDKYECIKEDAHSQWDLSNIIHL